MKTKTIPMHFRQGDVLITRVDAIPAGLAVRPRDNGRVILAYGEVTGHAHAIADSDVAAIYDSTEGDGSFFLRIGSATGLVHEEHSRIDLAPGDYKVTQQREYSPEEIRNVAD